MSEPAKPSTDRDAYLRTQMVRFRGLFSRTGPWWLFPAVIGTGLYGGYFGAAQGVILIGLMGVALTETLVRINGLKNVLVGLANGVAGIVFAVVSQVDWAVAAALAVGSVLGAQGGVRVGRLLPPVIYRVIIVVVGVVAIVAIMR